MGNNKRVLKAIDRELKDRYRSKRYSKSLSATNSLFAPNYLFSKPSMRRIYNPNAKYFEHGGVHGNVNPIEGDLYSKVLMNRNRGVGFVDRAFALGDNPGTPLFNVPDDEQFGSYMSHKMAYGSDDSGQTWMYPTILNDDDEAIKVPNQYADYISRDGYKKATGMMRKNGGNVSWNFKGKSYSGTLIPSMETENNRYARTHNGKIKTLPKRNHGGPHDPPQESAEGQKDWMMNYIQSPMYLKRLSKEFPDYSNEELEAERNARLSNVKNVNIKYPRYPLHPEGYGNISGEYYAKNIKPGDFTRRISTGELVKDEIDNSKSGNLYLETPYRPDVWFPEEGYNTIPLHEIGHAADDGGSRIPYKTEKFIYDSTNKAYAGPLNYDILPWDNATKVINELPFKYKNTPTEFVNRLIPLRYELERAGIWKPGEEDFIDGMYNLMLKNPDVMKNAHIQDVLDEIPGANESRSKRAIVTKLLNEIALSDVEQDLNVAKHGGPHDPPNVVTTNERLAELKAAYEAEAVRASEVMKNAHELGLKLGTNEDDNRYNYQPAKGYDYKDLSFDGNYKLVPRKVQVGNTEDWNAIGMGFVNNPMSWINNLKRSNVRGDEYLIDWDNYTIDNEGNKQYEYVLDENGDPIPNLTRGQGCIGAMCGIYSTVGATNISDYKTGTGKIAKAGDPIFKQMSNAFWDADDEAALIAAGFEKIKEGDPITIGALARVLKIDEKGNRRHSHTAMVNALNEDGTAVDFNNLEGFIENPGGFDEGIRTSKPYSGYDLEYYNYIGDTKKLKKEYDDFLVEVEERRKNISRLPLIKPELIKRETSSGIPKIIKKETDNNPKKNKFFGNKRIKKHGGPHEPPSYEDAMQAYKDSIAAKEAYEKQYALDLKKYTDDSQHAEGIYDKYNRNQAYINYIQGFYSNFNPENNYKKYSTFPGLKDPEDILRVEELDDGSKRFYIRSLHNIKNSRSNLSDFKPPSPMMEFYHGKEDTYFDNVIAFDYIPKPKISKPEPAPEYNAPEVLERPNFADYVDPMPVIKPELVKQDVTLPELVGVPNDGLVEDYILDRDGNIAGSVRVPAGTRQNKKRNYRKLKRGKLDGTMGVFNGERYGHGGSVELGDEVDEATMQRLKEQGYTFEEI